MSGKILQGSCLCGGIVYEIHAPLEDVLNCHCGMCRKAQGAAFRTRASVRVSDFHFVSGESLLRFYESSPGEERSFCSVCSATIITRYAGNPGSYGFALGTLDDDPQVSIQRHVFTKYRAPWYEISDELPQIEDIEEEELAKIKQRQ